MSKDIGAKLVVESLEAKGVDYIFTLSGGHITPIYQFLENSSIKIFDTRHEQAAVFMAEAWSRMTRKPGIAMVTAGPGFTNALSGIANARFSNSPVLLISGCVGLGVNEKLDLQDMVQAPVITPMVKKAFVCYKPERIGEYIDMAYRTAISGRPGPVYLEIPVDVLNSGYEEKKVKRLNTVPDSKPVDIAGVDKLMELLGEAKKPVIIAGAGAYFADAGPELKEFVEAAGIPIFTATLGRGLVPDTHPLCFEGSLAVRPGAAMQANMMADLVLLFGVRMTFHYMFGDIFGKKAKIVQVDITGEEIGRNRSVDYGIVSDIKSFVGVLNSKIKEKKVGDKLTQQYQEWVEYVKKSDTSGKSAMKANWESDNVPIHPIRLAKEVNDFMDREDDFVIADGGDTQVWMGMTRTVKKQGHYFDSGQYGCLAIGLPFANAVKLRNPDKRVCLIIGDGSVGFNFMEFETAVRKNLPIVVVISNDLGWGMIRHSQELRLGHAIENGTYIGKVDYHKIVEGLGVKGFYVEKPEDIRPALEEAFASGKPCCINVMTDPTTVSPGSVALANIGAYK